MNHLMEILGLTVRFDCGSEYPADMYKILLVMGFVLLGHAAYSAVQCEFMWLF